MFLGSRGTGKTHLSTGLGIRACQAGHSVASATAAQWIARLAGAHHAGRLQDELTKLGRVPLLIIDDPGLRDIIDIMSDSLLIRNLPESLKPALRRRAAAHGRSVEAEARVILEEAIAAEEDFVSWWLDEMGSAPAGEPLPAPDRAGQSREPVTFE